MSVPPRRGKGKIKPPRALFVPDSRNQETWRQLSQNIREIQNHNASRLSFEENYRFAYNMVSGRQGRVLYEGTKSLVVDNLDKLARTYIVPTFPLGGESDAMEESAQGEQLLKSIRVVYDDHTGSMAKLRDVLKYMDRVYSTAENVPQIWDAGLQLFIDRIVGSPMLPIREHVLNGVLKQIRLERDGFPINRSAIKGFLDVYRNLHDNGSGSSVYIKELEPSILAESEAYYKREGETLISTCEAPEYLRRVEERFQSEHQRASHYFHNTMPALIAILEKHLLTPHLHSIVSMQGSGIDPMIDLGQSGDLARMYSLFLRVPNGLWTLKRALKDSIAERGRLVNEAEGSEVYAAGASKSGIGAMDQDINVEVSKSRAQPLATPKSAKSKGKERAIPNGDDSPKSALPVAPTPQSKKTLDAALKWVQDVLDLKDVFDRLLKLCFQDDKTVQTAMNEAFESFINLHPKAPEFISLFIDENLKKGLKGKSDDEVDTVLDKTITVFRFITEKDVFERYYKSHLAKRLLTGRSVSDDAEKGMLAKLKVECGFQFTQKLEGMFHDIKISTDTTQAYKVQVGTGALDPPPFEISVQVLTSTFWPMSHVPVPFTFAPDMLRACGAFERFYLSRHSGRRLSWQPSLGSADVRVTFKNRKHDLNVSTYALVILLLFEDLGPEDFLTYEEIKEATLIGDVELARNLQSLACAKFKILRKHPVGREVDTEDSFSFNNEFSSPLQRIKISTVSSKVESTGELKETRDKVDEERKFQTEACIVRIMKDRKTMSHNDLINEVTRQLAARFTPNPLAIKKRIEALLDREYMDRGEDKKSYLYVA